MGSKKKKVFIVYFSPAGSTRHVADIIEKQFLTLGAEVSSIDLAECSNDVATVISQQMVASKSCLFVGSPVYVSHAVPPVMEFIAELKEGIGAFAVPFVTWGGACSGISFFKLLKPICRKEPSIRSVAINVKYVQTFARRMRLLLLRTRNLKMGVFFVLLV